MAKGRFYKKTDQQMNSEDGSMIREDRSAVANLPQNVVMKDWPRTTYFNHTELNRMDSVSGIDNQIDADVSKANKHRSKSKY